MFQLTDYKSIVSQSSVCLCLKMHWIRSSRSHSQWAFGAKMTSYERRCDVITSHRRKYDVILAPKAHWD